MEDPVIKLQQYLLRRLPNLERWLDAAREKHDSDASSEYWLFAFVVRPYIDSLHATGSGEELAHAWDVLEHIATYGTDAEKNELFVVVVEELKPWRFYRFMGPALRDHWIRSLTWYPTHRTRTELMNTHVDKIEFRYRWLNEIEQIGGFEYLTTEQEIRIHTLLWNEFQIERWQR